MSLSRPQSDNPNPAKKFIEFKNGEFAYYDKKKKEKVKIDLPIRFTVCDELSTITGWSDKDQCGIYSNEVHRTTLEPLTVKAFKASGQIAKGLYQEIKGDIVAAGGEFTKSVYAFMNGELVNFKFRGSSLGGWIEKDKQKINVNKQSIEVKELKEVQNKAIKYLVPVFEGIDMLDEDEAREADDILQKYLDEKKVVRVERDTDDESREFQEKYEDFDPDPPEDNRHPHTKRAGEALKDFETGNKPETGAPNPDLPH